MSSLELASETPLHKLLSMLQETETHIDGIDWTRQDPLMEAGKIKVDSYKFIHDKLSAQLLYFDQLATYYKQAKDSAQSQLKGFEDHLKFVMDTQRLEKVEGKDFAIVMHESSFCDVNAECLPRHRVIYGDKWVKVKYSWALTPIREALDGDDDELRTKALEIAKVGFRTRPKFELIKVERKSRAKNSASSRSKKSKREEPAEPAPALVSGPEGTGNHEPAFDPIGSDTLLHADPFAEYEHDAFFDHEYVAEESEAPGM